MADFESSSWSNPEFAQGFVEAADVFMPLRRSMMAMLRSFYLRFVKPVPGPRRVLELGSGHGVHTLELLRADPGLEATLADGSDHMIQSAKERLKEYPRTKFVTGAFEQLLVSDPIQDRFKFIFSSMAIHHLVLAEKWKCSSMPIGIWRPMAGS